MNIPKELKLINIDEYKSHFLQRKSMNRPMHESLYIAPNGKIIDCKYPNLTGSHIQTTQLFYKNIYELANSDEYKDLNIKKSYAYPEREDYIARIIQIKDKLKQNAKLDFVNNKFSTNEYSQEEIFIEHINSLLKDDDLIVQDLGFIRLMCMKENFNTHIAVTIPVPILKGKSYTANQMDTIKQIENILEIYGICEEVEKLDIYNKKMAQQIDRYVKSKQLTM